MARHNRAHELTRFLDVEGRCVRRRVLTNRFGRQALDTALVEALVVELLLGLMVHAARASEFSTRVRAASEWLPRGAAVSGLAALSLYALVERNPSQITVVVGSDLRLRAPAWMRVRRTGPLARIQIKDGVRCATRERAVIDAWCEARPHERVSAVLEAMRRSTITGTAVLRVLSTMPRVTHRRELLGILAAAAGGIQSYLELLAKRTVLNTSEFNGLLRQVEVTAMGKNFVLDTYHQQSRTVIEFDGARVHGTRLAKKRDNTRDAALATRGMLTLRIGYDDVVQRPDWCRDVIRRAIAMRTGGTPVRLNGV